VARCLTKNGLFFVSDATTLTSCKKRFPNVEPAAASGLEPTVTNLKTASSAGFELTATGREPTATTGREPTAATGREPAASGKLESAAALRRFA
jgi:hypothetical protein